MMIRLARFDGGRLNARFSDRQNPENMRQLRID
jgi:hypothetical protein